MRAYGLLNNGILACLVLFLALIPLGVNLVWFNVESHRCTPDLDFTQSVYATGLQGVIFPVFGCMQVTYAIPFALMIG